MATVTWLRGWRVFIGSNDHNPAHVHVTANGITAIFVLNCPDGPVMLRDNYGCSLPEVNRLRKELEEADVSAKCCLKWKVIHGHRT